MSRFYPTKPIPLPTYQGASSSNTYPFEVIPGSGGLVRVNWYSYLMKDFNIRNPVPVFGLDIPFQLKYPNKVYLETYFNAQLVPVVSRVRTDDRWIKSGSSRITTGGATETIPTYPNEIELITKADLAVKSAEIQSDISEVNAQAALARTNVQNQIQSKAISQQEGERTLLRINQLTQAYQTRLEELKNSFNTAFNTNNKKQLKCFTLLAYSTHDTHGDLGSKTVSPDTASNEKPFQLVQCTTSDLMLVDTCFRNIPCKIAIPWHRPVYQYFLQSGITEDEENTGIKNV